MTQRQRKNLIPAFTYRHVKDLYPIFWTKSSALVNGLMSVSQSEGREPGKAIHEAPIVEISGWAKRATLDIIGSAVRIFEAHVPILDRTMMLLGPIVALKSLNMLRGSIHSLQQAKLTPDLKIGNGSRIRRHYRSRHEAERYIS